MGHGSPTSRSTAWERAAQIILACLLIQIILRWGGRSVVCAIPWVRCSSGKPFAPPSQASAALSTPAAMAMVASSAALPEDVWRGDVPGDVANASAGATSVSWHASSRHFVQEPFSWRRNRKKITELTVSMARAHRPRAPRFTLTSYMAEHHDREEEREGCCPHATAEPGRGERQRQRFSCGVGVCQRWWQ